MGNVEVDIDGALLACERDAELDVGWIDELLETAVAGRVEGKMRWDVLVRELLQSDRLGESSVVRSMTYLLSTR